MQMELLSVADGLRYSSALSATSSAIIRANFICNCVIQNFSSLECNTSSDSELINLTAPLLRFNWLKG